MKKENRTNIGPLVTIISRIHFGDLTIKKAFIMLVLRLRDTVRDFVTQL